MMALSSETIIMRNQIFVRGGDLKETEFMRPTLCTVEGREFIALSPTDNKLLKYMGKSEQSRDFIELLKERRNNMVDELLEEKMDVFVEEHGQCKRRKIDLYDELPRIIAVSVPVGMDFANPATMTMLASHRRHERVWTEFSVSALNLLRAGVAGVDEVRPRKSRRSKDERVEVKGCPDVHYNEQRNSWFIRYSDVEGRQHTKHFAWVRSDIEDVSNQHREEAARKAQSEFDSLNVIPVEAAGDA